MMKTWFIGKSLAQAATLALLLTAATVISAQNMDARAKIVHNSWRSGAAMPTARMGAAFGVIGTKIYVTGGVDSTGAFVNTTEIYDTMHNTWTTDGATIPTPTWVGASAAVKNILYVIGGATPSELESKVVEAYDPATNSWSTNNALMPTQRNSVTAVADGGKIYVIGGFFNGSRIPTVERYDPAKNSWAWKREADLFVGKSETQLGVFASEIVAAGGLENSGYTNENEGYSPTTKWRPLKHALIAGQGGCTAVIKGKLYIAGGNDSSGVFNSLEAYNSATGKWRMLRNMPQALTLGAGATVGGKLYCIGGANGPGRGATTYANVQIYQP